MIGAIRRITEYTFQNQNVMCAEVGLFTTGALWNAFSIASHKYKWTILLLRVGNVLVGRTDTRFLRSVHTREHNQRKDPIWAVRDLQTSHQ